MSATLSDLGNAHRIRTQFSGQLIYCYEYKKWFVWDGMRWALDKGGAAIRLAQQAATDYSSKAEASDKKTKRFAVDSLNSHRIQNALAMAAPMMSVQAAQLDQNPWLVNFKNGTLDLRTKELLPHNPKDFITKLVHYNYDAAALANRWNLFLDQILGTPEGGELSKERSARLKSYLQKAFGYSMTGSVREKCVFFLFGATDNGKSTMLDTFRGLMSEYSTLILVDTLVSKQETSSSSADLAGLMGARFAQTSETEKGQEFSQSKLKRICQGRSKIKARRLYENPIEFLETHKLWIDSNKKPKIADGEDQATFNRLNPIEFLITIPKDQQDKDLDKKFEAEAEGILAWCVEGAYRWYQEGLQRPIDVEMANREWAEESDQLGRFIADYCDLGPGFAVSSTTLHKAYVNWAETMGEESYHGANKFGREMGFKFKRDHQETGSTYLGVKVKDGIVGETSPNDKRKPSSKVH